VGLPEGWDKDLPVYSPADAAVATRTISGKILNIFAKRIPGMIELLFFFTFFLNLFIYFLKKTITFFIDFICNDD
jgi:hypothetical protein